MHIRMMQAQARSAVQIVIMTEKDLAWTWAQHVGELAGLLLAVDAQEATAEVLLRIQALVQRELLLMYIRFASKSGSLGGKLPAQSSFGGAMRISGMY